MTELRKTKKPGDVKYTLNGKEFYAQDDEIDQILEEYMSTGAHYIHCNQPQPVTQFNKWDNFTDWS